MHSRLVFLRAVGMAILIIVVTTLIGPLTNNKQSYRALDDATHRWSRWGDQVLGLDLTAPRQNIFSLIRDLSRVITITDHSVVYSSYTLGLVKWISRGAIYTVADALEWLDIPLTARQARSIGLCRKLYDLNDNSIIVQSDPWQYGIASWYGPGFHGQLAASGEIYNMYGRTAAHRTLPLQSLVRVVSQRSGQNTIVRINDRGPYVAGRIIDMSYGAKELLGMDDLAAVYIERLDPTALDDPCE